MKLERPWEVDRSKVGGWKVWRREEWWVGWKLSWVGVGVGGRGEVCREDILYVSPPRGKASEANADLVARYLVKLGMWLVE